MTCHVIKLLKSRATEHLKSFLSNARMGYLIPDGSSRLKISVVLHGLSCVFSAFLKKYLFNMTTDQKSMYIQIQNGI